MDRVLYIFLIIIVLPSLGLSRKRETRTVTINDYGTPENRIVQRYQEKLYGFPKVYYKKYTLDKTIVGKPDSMVIKKSMQEAESRVVELRAMGFDYGALIVNFLIYVGMVIVGYALIKLIF